MHATRPRDGSRLRDHLLAAVRAGEMVTIVARRLGIPGATMYSWKARDPEFSAARSEAVRAQRPVVRLAPIDQDAPLDRDEWERLLAEACRSGNVQALRLLREVHPEECADHTRAVARRLLAAVP